MLLELSGQPGFETRTLSSLSKVFADEELTDERVSRGTALINEVYSFQVAYRRNGQLLEKLRVRIESDLSEVLQARSVGLVPSELPCYHDPDTHILRSTPGLYPDPLYDLVDDELTAVPNQWRAIWITVRLNGTVEPGFHSIRTVFEWDECNETFQETFELEVIPVELPEQQLIHTEWFHADCLAAHYGVDVFSDEHWGLIEQFVSTATAHGINMILTPLFTLPLDTEVGGERPTLQLVDVEKAGERYQFSFERLSRWIALCTARGVKYFEFSHLFTQWGAHHAPKIVAVENGHLNKIFGWDTDAKGPEYRNFLDQFLPALVDYVDGAGLRGNVYFHVADEPNLSSSDGYNLSDSGGEASMESYLSASQILRKHVSNVPVVDAVSNYGFYERGLVEKPIPATDHLEPFLRNEVPGLWTYYCCDQYKGVSNRFFNFPSVRNRILGLQLYKFEIAGFLHWGYNFWFSRLSRRLIDPFRNTDADLGFPSGDAFLVYPGERGPIESLRMEVFFEAIQDQRALQLLEGMIGKDEVLKLLEGALHRPLSFSEYPHESSWLLAKREEINRRIAVESSRKAV